MRKQVYYVCFCCLLLQSFSIGCLKDENSKTDNQNSTFSTFISKFEKVEIKSISDTKLFYNENVIIPYRLDLVGEDRIMIVSPNEWKLQLLSKKGKSYGISGGNGMGPDEFQVINAVNVDDENDIYVLDTRSNKVEFYGTNSDSLFHNNTLTLPSHHPYLIFDFVKVSGQYFGIFKDFFSSNSSHTFSLFALDEELKISEKIYELPPNDLAQGVVEGFMQDRFLGYRTYWAFRNGKLFFTNSKEFAVTEIDLVTHSIKNYDLGNFPKRKIKQEEIEYVLNEYKDLTTLYPKVEEELKEQKYFPYFNKFDITSKYAYFQLLNFSTEGEDQVLRINLSDKKREVISVTNKFSFQRASDSTIFGIYFGEEDIFPMHIELK